MSSNTPTWFSNVKPGVFISTFVTIAIFLAMILFDPVGFEALTQNLKAWITTSFSWFYVLTVALFLFILVYLACSSVGKVKLGPDHSIPEYKNSSWFAMLFTAGMGIGLMFFGVAEPVMHYVSPPAGDPETIAAAQQAMRITFFHWGLHAWAIYAIVGLSLAYFAFRHSLPLKVRSALFPLIGQKIYGPIGDGVDTFATIGTIFGVATTLGFGVTQINSGFNYLFGWEKSIEVQIGLIVFVTFLASLSVGFGLDKGIKRLSELNLILAITLLLFVFFATAPVYILQTTIQNAGAYVSNLFSMTFNLYAYKPNGWIGGWTILYWAWWISWSPFVGMFIARVSRGRTIREFIVGVLLIPTGFTLIWIGVMGNGALHSILNGNAHLITAVQQDSSVALFEFLSGLPAAGITSFIATVLVVLFFVTSADSGALVIDYLTAKTEKSPLWQRLFWTIVIALLSIMLLAVGGLTALQSATIISALPFTFIMLLICWGLLKAVKLDTLKARALQDARITPRLVDNPRSWQNRLGVIMPYPHTYEEVITYIHKNFKAALESIQHEFQHRGLKVNISDTVENGLALTVDHHDEHNFIYKVIASRLNPPSFIFKETEENQPDYYQAEVFLHEGGQNYDVMDWTEEDLIQDILDQYERHLHFLNLVRASQRKI